MLTGAGAQFDTTAADGRLAFGILAAFAKFGRELIAKRTRVRLTDRAFVLKERASDDRFHFNLCALENTLDCT